MPEKRHRRLARRIQPVAVDNGIAGRVHDADVLQSRTRQRVGGPLRRTPHIGCVLWKRADARYCEVLLQFVNVAVAVDVDEVDDVVHEGDLITEAPPLTIASGSALALEFLEMCHDALGRN